MVRISFGKKLLYFLGLRDLSDKDTVDFYPSVRSICVGVYCIGLFLLVDFLLKRVSIVYRVLLFIIVLYISVEVCYRVAIYLHNYKKGKQ